MKSLKTCSSSRAVISSGSGSRSTRAWPTNVPHVLGDHIQLQQVLLNLILNACDAMAANPPASRHLTLATAHRDGAVRISVSDTGCGLPPDAARIFEPFYTTKTQGLGLGLSICRSIVRAHKGRLWAEARGPGDSIRTACTRWRDLSPGTAGSERRETMNAIPWHGVPAG